MFTLATPTICGFAQHLAKTLVIHKCFIPVGQDLVDGTTYRIRNRRFVDEVLTERALRLNVDTGALLLSLLKALF